MANPNTAMRYAAKRPYEPVVGYDRRSEEDAERVAAGLRAEGWEVKVTTRRLWRWAGKPGQARHKEWLGTEHNVWKRPA